MCMHASHSKYSYMGPPIHTDTEHTDSMPPVGFELTTPVFEQAKRVHTLGRAAIGIIRLQNKLTLGFAC